MDRLAKERLINDDFVARNTVHSSVKRETNDTFWRSFMIALTLINVAACVTACICAGYCYKTKNNESFPAPSTIKPDIGTTAFAQTHEIYQDNIELAPVDSVEYVDTFDNDSDNYLDDSSDDDDDDYDDDDDDESADYEDDSYDYTVDDEDNDLEASGDDAEDVEQDIELKSNNKELVRKPSNRKRRSTANACETKCKGKRPRCLKKCMNKNERKVRKVKSIDLPAVHFEADIPDEDLQEKVGGQYDTYRRSEKCKNIPELEGILCLNRTFFPRKRLEPLRIFKKSSWYDDAKSPVDFSNSVVTAKSGGIYLVYAQAYIGGSEPMKIIAVVQKRNGNLVNKLRCDNGVNSEIGTPQLQTCSITGLMKLEVSDTIEIQAITSTEYVMYQKDMTYFGLVKVSGDGASSRNKARRKS